MKNRFVVVALVALLLGPVGMAAQTPEEIVNKMSAQMDRGDAEGLVLDFNMKIPVVGTVTSHNKVLGKKMRMEVTAKDKKSIIWTDETTRRTYDKQTNILTIEANTPAADKQENGNMETFKGDFVLQTMFLRVLRPGDAEGDGGRLVHPLQKG